MSIPLVDQATVEIAFKGSIAAAGGSVKLVNNIFHFQRTMTANPLVKSQINTAFQTAIGDIILAALNAGFTQSSNDIRIIDDDQDRYASFTQAGVGAIAGDRLPTNVAVTMAYRTAVRGRFAMGSKHFAPVTEADTTGDVLTGAGLARWQTLQAALLAGFVDASTNNWVPVIWSKTYSNSIVNPTNLLVNAVTEVLLNKSIGSMKRRRQKTVR